MRGWVKAEVSDTYLSGGSLRQVTRTMRGDFTKKPWYSSYVLFILGLVSILNYYDRFLMTVLLEPIKRDLHISDGQIGLLAGIGFALMYGLLGVPMARLADRYGRAPVLGAVLMLWSAMTAVCGATVNFTTMLLARTGVGIGEAGGLPTVNALIADYFSPRRRGLAISMIGVCSMIGANLSLIFGGLLNDRHGWRIAYYLASVPGFILAIVIFLTIRDPRAQPSGASAPVAVVPLSVALKTLWNRKSFVLLCLGMGIGSIVGYAQQAWNPAFLMRTYHISPGQVGSRYAAVVAPAAIVAILLGGVANDRLTRRDQRWPLWIVALSFGLNVPASLAFFLIHEFTLAMSMAVVSTILVGLWVAPAYTLVQRLAGTQSRALAAALFMMILNIVGQGLGPTITGMLSDRLSPELGNRSLMVSLCIVSMAGAVAVIPFLLAARTVKADMADANS